MPPSRTLVTAAASWIGCRLVRMLVARGEQVTVLTREDTWPKSLRDLPRESLRWVFGDLSIESTAYRSLMSCRRVYHLISDTVPNPKRSSNSCPDRVIDELRTLLGMLGKSSVERVLVSLSAEGWLHSEPQIRTEQDLSAAGLPVDGPSQRFVKPWALLADACEMGLPLVVALPTSLMGQGPGGAGPLAQILLDYLRVPAHWTIPTAHGGLNLVDVDDVAEGHLLAMDRGLLGQCYILGGENLSWEDFFRALSDVTGLAVPLRSSSSRLASSLLAMLHMAVAWGSGRAPVASLHRLHSWNDRWSWVSSERAKADLGYFSRTAQDSLGRGVRFMMQNGSLSGSEKESLWLLPDANQER